MSKRRPNEEDGGDDEGGSDATARCTTSTTPKRSAAASAARSAAPDTVSYVTTTNGERMQLVDIRAFGLEDRAEAAIAVSKRSWSLAHLAKWRNNALATADASSSTSDTTKKQSSEYVRQRQRAYMKQLYGKPTQSQ